MGPSTDPVAQALRDFQAAYGLPVDGVAGPRTLAALNEPPWERERLLELNLERARALPVGLGERHVVVDAAAARLYLYEDGQVKDTMKVIVGKPTEQTPMIAGLIRYAVLNPYWNVPPDLVEVADRAARPQEGRRLPQDDGLRGAVRLDATMRERRRSAARSTGRRSPPAAPRSASASCPAGTMRWAG